MPKQVKTAKQVETAEMRWSSSVEAADTSTSRRHFDKPPTRRQAAAASTARQRHFDSPPTPLRQAAGFGGLQVRRTTKTPKRA